MQATATTEPLRRVGPYTLGRLLGRGDRSAVYAAEDPRTRTAVAIKLLALPAGQSAAEHATLAARLERDARALIGLTRPPRIHPHIVHMRDVGFEAAAPDGPAHYLVMELLEGDTLRERMERSGPLPPSETADYLLQIADALTAMHEEGVVHCAVRPENVFLDGPGGRTAKVMDFGVHCPTRADDLAAMAGMERVAPYLSPEQVAGRPATAASDVWALGVLLYEMLAARPPFGGFGSTADALYDIAYGSAAPIPGLNDNVDRVLMHALERDPARRYPTAMALARDFRAAAATLPASAPERTAATIAIAAPLSAPAPAAVQRRRHEGGAGWKVAAAMAGVLGVAALGVGLSSLRPQHGALGTNHADVKPPPTRLASAEKPAASKPAPAKAAAAVAGTPAPVTPTPRPPSVAVVADAAPYTPTPAATAATPEPAVEAAAATAVITESTPAPTPAAPATPNNRRVAAVKPIPASPTPVPATPSAVPSAPTVARREEEAAPVPRRAPTPLPATPPTPAVAAATPAPAVEPAESRHPASEGDSLTFKGPWRGSYAGSPAVLTVEKQNDEEGTFSGTVLVQTDSGPVALAVKGRLRDEDGTPGLELKEERVVRQPSGTPWRTATTAGVLTPGGMRSADNGQRSWSFAR